MPTITAIIPTYNSAQTIGRALDSALAQTLPCHEIIVVDDCSKDDTVAVVEGYQARHPAIKIFRQDVNQGPAAARNRAIRAATSDWIAILDSDDAWVRERNAALLDAAEKTNADIVFDNLILYDPGVNRNIRPAYAEDFDHRPVDALDFWRNSRFGTFTYSTFKLNARRAFLVDNNLYYPDMRYGEDMVLYGALMNAGARAVKLGRGYYLYTVRQGEVSGARNTASQSLPNFTAIADGIAGLRQSANETATPGLLHAMAKSEASFRTGDRLNRLRAAVRGGRYGEAMALAADHRVWALHRQMKRRQKEVAKLRYPQ
jgi:succinoglycan biosynthesis protein ExoO